MSGGCCRTLLVSPASVLVCVPFERRRSERPDKSDNGLIAALHHLQGDPQMDADRRRIGCTRRSTARIFQIIPACYMRRPNRKRIRDQPLWGWGTDTPTRAYLALSPLVIEWAFLDWFALSTRPLLCVRVFSRALGAKASGLLSRRDASAGQVPAFLNFLRGIQVRPQPSV